MKQGDRVTTPKGPGTVVYVRLNVFSGAPMAASVCQDCDREQPGYVGTIWDVHLVSLDNV